MEASRLAPSGTTYTWVPREQNKHADRLANEALDGKRSGVTVAGEDPAAESLIEEIESPAEAPPRSRRRLPRLVGRRRASRPRWSWCGTASPRTPSRSGSPAAWRAPTPGLSDEGRDQIRAAADWLAPLAERVDAVVASPVRRTRESAEILAEVLGQDRRGRAGLRRDGVRHLGRADLRRGRRAATRTTSTPGSGRSTSRRRRRRVVPGRSRSGCWPGCSGVLDAHAGKTVVVVSHVTPIKTLVAHARRRAAGVGVPDGADAGVGDACCRSSSAARTGPRSARRCGCSTPCRRATTRSAAPSAGTRLRPGRERQP